MTLLRTSMGLIVRIATLRAKGDSSRHYTARALSPLLIKTVLWSLVVGLTCWIAALWLREALATPAPTEIVRSRPAIDPDGAVAAAVAAPIFGEATRPDVAQSTGPVFPDVKLRGVFAGGNGPAAAIFEMGDDERFVLVGRELAPGVVLHGVYATYVLIGSGAVTQRVELEAIESEASRHSKSGTSRHTHGHGKRPPAPPPPEAPADSPPAIPDAQPAAPPAQPMQQSSTAIRVTSSVHA